MPRRLLALSFALVALHLFTPIAASGQASVGIQAMDPIYRDLDRLSAFGLLDRFLLGGRTFTRLDAARFATDAREALVLIEGAAQEPEWAGTAREILTRIEGRLGPELDRIDSASPTSEWVGPSYVEGLYARSPAREIPDNGLGGIEADVNPLLQHREGRPRIDGGTLELETTHTGFLSNAALIHLSPRVTLSIPEDGGDATTELELQRAYLRFVISNVEITLGRESLFLGPSQRTSLAGSANAMPLDMVKIGTDRPFIPPWILGYLGPSEIFFFFSDLGSDQHYPHTKLYGYKFSTLPWENVELGGTVAIQGGGEGSPEASIGEYVADFLIIPDLFMAEGDFQFSNKFVGLDFRVRIPSLRGTTLYWDLLVDDFDVRRLGSSLSEDAGHVVGVHLPRLDRQGRWGLGSEFRKTGLRYYAHGQFRSGYTRHRQILGDPLGPDASGVYGWLTWTPSASHDVSLNLSWDRRSNDQYAVDNSDGWDFIKTEDRPEEQRYRVAAQWVFQDLRRPIRVFLEAGLERAENFAFQEGSDRSNGLLGVRLEYNPSRR